jgi:para-aminobenzoate synthetase component 1
MEKKDIEKINILAQTGVPFLFIINFKGDSVIVKKLSDINSERILYSVNKYDNYLTDIKRNKNIWFNKYPVSYAEYSKAFTIVHNHLSQGNSYLTNLTFETPVKTNLSLKEIFLLSNAPYKLLYNNEFVVFSPEIFIKVEDRKIMSFPMKGTIDANIPNAGDIILNNKKETAEHATIVDLIRNDLSIIAKDVSVDKYRYIDTINTNQGKILQVSSQISGVLNKDYRKCLGNIIDKLLPAGSISGAPKQKTMEIISEAENYDRGFYTGIFGIFDGENLDSAVMIRFIENREEQLFFKSGGGITVNSNPQEEYYEMIQKIYLPFSN